MNVGGRVLKQKFKKHPNIMWKSYHLCEKHFTKSSFRSNVKRKLLKRTAVPIPISSTEFNAESCKMDHGYSMEPPYEDETVSLPTKTTSTSLQTQNSTSTLAIGDDPHGKHISDLVPASDFHDPASPLQETAPVSHIFESEVCGLIIVFVILINGPVIYIYR